MEFRVLGPLEAEDGGKLLPLGGPKQRAVLAFLLLHGNQAVSLDTLADALWGEDQPPTAAKTLRVYVSRLRMLLPARIESRGGGYRLRAEPGETDLDRLRQLRAAGRHHEALGLFRGPPLADFTYEPWAQSEIGRLEELRLATLEDRIDADLAAGRHDELIGELDALTKEHPLRERLHGQLMLALYRAGRQAEALEAFQRARRRLVDELGIDPTPRLQQLEMRILNQDPGLDLAPAEAAEPTSPPAPEPHRAQPGTRRTVTAVFIDLVDSTALGEGLDPELLRSVLDRYFATAAGILRRHGGTVEKFIGDAVTCVFGVPVLHEDDAIRAVRAAADVRTAVGQLSDELAADVGVRLDVRIGINTGEVVVTHGDASERLVTGDPVNVAAGLEQSAGAGEIVIGASTYRLVRDAVRTEALGPLTLKRRREPVPAHRVLDVRTGAAAVAQRLDSPLIGRTLELAEARHAFDRAVRDQTSILLTVLGPAGIGKSRLAAELAASLSDDATVLDGHCLPYGDGITFWPVAEMVRQVPDADPLELTDAAGPETFLAVRRFFEELARRRPLVAIFEDIHWAEPTLLDLIEHVADTSRGAPLLLLCLARTELVDERPGWAGGKLNATSLLLEPLSETECLALVDRIAPGLDARARGRVVHASEGNPLFVEQLLALLGDEAASEEELPSTIQSLLAARLDRLPPDERTLLEHAAVEGRVFHIGAIASADDARLLALVRKELIRPERSSVAGEEAFRFRHILLRDVAYAALPKAERARLHERFAAWLEERVTGHETEYEEILGYHLEQAVAYRQELGRRTAEEDALAGRAATHLASAGVRARGRGDTPAAANLLSRAHRLAPGASGPELALELGTALIEVGRFDEATRALRAAEEQAPDERLRTHARLARLLSEMYLEPEGKTDAAYREGKRALGIFRRYGDEQGLARAWELIAESYSVRGPLTELERAGEELERHALRAHDGQLRSKAAAMRFGAILYGPRPAAEGIALIEDALRRDDLPLREEALARRELGVLRAMTGDPAAGRELLAQAAALTQELGLTLGALLVRDRLAQVEGLAGDWEEAERILRGVCGELEQLGEQAYLSTESARLGVVLVELGRFDEAEEATLVSERAAASDDVISQVTWRGARARVLAARGAHDAAVDLAREAVALVAATDALDDHGDALQDLAVVLRAAGRLDEACAAGEAALRLYERKGDVVSADRVRALLGQVETASP